MLKEMNMQFQLKSIGRVEHRGDEALIVLDEEYREGLKGLEGFSHILVIWWAHMYSEDMYRAIRVLDSPYTKGPDKIGVFATRSPVRPNPVAVSVVQAGSIDHSLGEISVPYIDAETDTPVLDIKPYHPSEDRVKNVAVPEWCGEWPKWMEDSGDFDWDKVFNF